MMRVSDQIYESANRAGVDEFTAYTVARFEVSSNWMFHANPPSGLNDHGDSTPFGYFENDNANGWPAMDDYDPWSTLLGGDAYSTAVHGALERNLDGTRNGVDELLADCVAQDRKPNVKGVYWLRFVPQSPGGCTDVGKASARRFVFGGKR